MEYLRELILSPFGNNLLLDAEWYHQAAERVRQGMSSAPGEAYFRAPFYPIFLAGAYTISGGDVLGPRLLQALLGLVQIWMCWRIAWHTHGERVAAVVAPLAATYGMFIYFEGEILTTALGTFFCTAGLLLLLEGDRRASAPVVGAGGARARARRDHSRNRSRARSLRGALGAGIRASGDGLPGGGWPRCSAP